MICFKFASLEPYSSGNYIGLWVNRVFTSASHQLFSGIKFDRKLGLHIKQLAQILSDPPITFDFSVLFQANGDWKCVSENAACCIFEASTALQKIDKFSFQTWDQCLKNFRSTWLQLQSRRMKTLIFLLVTASVIFAWRVIAVTVRETQLPIVASALGRRNTRTGTIRQQILSGSYWKLFKFIARVLLDWIWTGTYKKNWREVVSRHCSIKLANQEIVMELLIIWVPVLNRVLNGRRP